MSNLIDSGSIKIFVLDWNQETVNIPKGPMKHTIDFERLSDVLIQMKFVYSCCSAL